MLASSLPFWNQTFVFSDLPLCDLRSKFLELSAWSYNRYSCNEFLGEVILDLSGTLLLYNY